MTDGTLTIRVTLPDLWREQKMEFASDTPVGTIKEQALPQLLRGSEADPAGYYVEYSEKEIQDESRTLSDLEVSAGDVISLRPYDMDHPAPFRG